MEALYLKIRDELARQIKNRVYREGETLPSEDELAERFGVSRPTIRRSIQELVDDGMLEKKPYRGTTVCPAKIEQGFTTMLRSFNEEILANGRIPRTTVLTARVQEASPEVSSRMGVEVGAPLFKLVRLRYAGDYPNVLVSSLIPRRPRLVVLRNTRRQRIAAGATRLSSTYRLLMEARSTASARRGARGRARARVRRSRGSREAPPADAGACARVPVAR